MADGSVRKRMRSSRSSEPEDAEQQNAASFPDHSFDMKLKIRKSISKVFRSKKRRNEEDGEAEESKEAEEAEESEGSSGPSGPEEAEPDDLSDLSDLQMVAFYDPTIKGKDGCGRTLEDILAFDDEKLEICHNYIQWLFPMPEASIFNEDCPVVTPRVFDHFRKRPELRDRLRLSFTRILAFYGFKIDYVKETNEDLIIRKCPTTTSVMTATGRTISLSRPPPPLPRIQPLENFLLVKENWDYPTDHNHLRITRILRSLRILGLKEEAEAFYNALMAVREDTPRISARSRRYWRIATFGPLHASPDGKPVRWWVERYGDAGGEWAAHEGK